MEGKYPSNWLRPNNNSGYKATTGKVCKIYSVGYDYCKLKSNSFKYIFIKINMEKKKYFHTLLSIEVLSFEFHKTNCAKFLIDKISFSFKFYINALSQFIYY